MKNFALHLLLPSSSQFPISRSQFQFCLNFVRCETIPWLPLCCCWCWYWCRQAETFGDRESCQQLPQKQQAGSKGTNRKTCSWPDLQRGENKNKEQMNSNKRKGARRRGLRLSMSCTSRTWAKTPGKLTNLDYKHNCHTCLHKCWQDC